MPIKMLLTIGLGSRQASVAHKWAPAHGSGTTALHHIQDV